jgi:hypothetical protein
MSHNYRRVVVYIFFFATATAGAYAFELQTTGIEAEVDVTGEFNRIFHYCSGISLSGVLELNNYFSLSSGLSLGALGVAAEKSVLAYNAFGRAGFRFPPGFPLELGFSYVYNGMPEHRTNIHTMLPLVSSRWKRAGFSLGTALRYTAYDREAPIFEPILAFMVFAYFINREDIRSGVKIANFSDFLAGNMGAYFLNLNVSIRIAKRLRLISEVEVFQAGSIGLTATFYGILCRGGINYQW